MLFSLTKTNKKQWAYSALFLTSLISVMAIYWPGLKGIFLVDDVYNLNTLNANGGVTSWETLIPFVFDNNSGMLGRPIAMLSFLIDDQYYPGSVEKYRYTNLMIHCLCGVLVFCFTRKLIQLSSTSFKDYAIEIALIASFWWMVSPLNVSTTLYIIQRMSQLSALFVLIGLYFYLHGRQYLSSRPVLGLGFILFGLYFCGVLAVLSKENGALIFCTALVIEVFLLAARDEKVNKIVLSIILLPLLVGALYVATHFKGLTYSSVRDFTATERLYTEASILWDYVFKIVFPLSGKMGLVHDDVEISRSLFELKTLVAVLAHACVITASLFYRKKYPFLFLSAFGFYSCHLLESTVIPLELYFEHRNYLASAFIYIGFSSGVWLALKNSRLLKGVFLGFIALFALVCSQRAQIWGSPKAQIAIWAMEHPDSVRAQTMYARSLIAEKKYTEAEAELNRLQLKWPDMIHNHLVVLNHACVGKMSLNYDPQEFVRTLESGSYDGSLPSILEETFRLYREDTCELIDASLMAGILKKVPDLKNAAHTFKAKVAFWEFELHGRAGYLDGALEALDRVYLYQKDSYVFYLKAAVFRSAGLNNEALLELDRAFDIENNKLISSSSKLEQYSLMKRAIAEILE